MYPPVQVTRAAYLHLQPPRQRTFTAVHFNTPRPHRPRRLPAPGTQGPCFSTETASLRKARVAPTSWPLLGCQSFQLAPKPGFCMLISHSVSSNGLADLILSRSQLASPVFRASSRCPGGYLLLRLVASRWMHLD